MAFCNRTPFIHSLKEVAMATEAVVMAGSRDLDTSHRWQNGTMHQRH
jgi:hypothetical protein